MKRILKNKVNILVATSFIFLFTWFVTQYAFVTNHSESLPLQVVLIKKGALPEKIGQIFVFRVKNNLAYKNKELQFIKLVGGLSGDEIEVKGGEIFTKNKLLKGYMDEDVFHSVQLFQLIDPEEFKKKQIRVVDKEIYVAGNLIGIIKPYSTKLKTFIASHPNSKFNAAEFSLHAINSGVIPPHKFFAYGTHKDSYDSRYQEIGLIDEKDIIGTAIFAW